MRIGYARVSTVEQNTSLQLSALRAARCQRIVEEKRSAAKSRPILDKLLSELQHGDELVVYKLDRLARSLQHLLQILERLHGAGVKLKSLTEPISDDTPAGRMMVQVLGAVAEFERAIIRERCMAGQLEAMKAGTRFGHRFKLSLQDQNEGIQLAGCGIPSNAIGEAYGLSGARIRQLHAEATGRKTRRIGQIRALLYRNITHAHWVIIDTFIYI